MFLIKNASVAVVAGAVLTLCACSSQSPTIRIGSKNTTEQMILGEIIAEHLEKQLPGIKIERKLGLGGTAVVQNALQSGGVDLYVEDMGTAVASVLQEDVPADAGVTLERARRQYQDLYQLTVLKPLGFHHRITFVGRANSTVGLKANTLTAAGLSGHAWVLGLAYKFYDRKDAFTALTTKYNLSLRELPKPMDPAAMYEALATGIIEMAGGYSTDAWVDDPGNRVFEDDRKLFPAQDVCIIVRNQTLKDRAGLDSALELLPGKFTDKSVRRMNQDFELTPHRKPEEIAKAFLASVGL
jgi:glycine betaine/choline ABC-type transport system substrate-binding protein